MKSRVAKRSVIIGGHKTSISLEDAFWNELKAIADERHIRLSDLVTTIDTAREYSNLSSALRVFVLGHYRRELANDQASRLEGGLPRGARTKPVSRKLA